MPRIYMRLCLCYVLLCSVTGSVWAQAPATPLHIAGESPGTARRFAAADQLAAEGKWTAAVNEYQQILDEAGDELVPIDTDHAVLARLLCHVRLAALPAEILKRYRERIDDQASRWLAQGQASRDARVLRRIVDEAFVSRSTDQALDLLGELAFERGDFDTAEHWWRLIVRPASDAGPAPGAKFTDLVYPDPHADVARVRAKQMLARLFRGDSAGVADELKVYRKKHGDAAGDFAGRVGKFAETLQLLADRPTPLFPPARRWTTFGGTPARNLVLSSIPGRVAWSFSPRRPLWRRQLVHGSHIRRDMEDSDSSLKPQTVARQLVVEPIVTAGQVLIAEPRSVTAYDLQSGAQTFQYTLPEGDRTPRLGLSAPEDLRCTLTVAENRVYARLGAPAIGPPSGQDGDATSYLLCLSMRSDPVLGHYRWGQQSKKGEFFEGTPVVRDDSVYIAVTQFTNTTATTSVVCYGATTGRPRWQHVVELCERRGKQPAERYRHHLLTLAGPNLVFCSHSGAVLALDAATGRRAWAVHYPSRGETLPGGDASPRDLCPCVFADGLVLAAPADYDRILCMDAFTGQVVWRSMPLEVVQLLGVSRGRLFFTTPNDLRALELSTGLTPRGWIQPDDGSSLPPFGRGFLTADLVFWPTENGLRVLRQEDAAPADEWYAFLAEEGPAARLGNLTFADDCLIVAGPDDLTVYASESVRLEANRAQAQAMPKSATAQYRLGLAQAAAGQDAAAWASFLRAGQLASAKDCWQGKSLRAAARAERHQLLLARAAEAVQKNAWDKAARLLRRASASEFTTEERITALTKLAQMWQAASKPEAAVEVWQSVLAEPELADGETIAARAIDDLMTLHGRAMYARFEQQARALLDASGVPSDDVLERVRRLFPNSAAAGSAARRLGRRQEQAGHWGAAADAYRQAIRKKQTTALAGLARCYEHERCWSAAETIWRLVATQGPGPGERAAAVARLRRPPYADSTPSDGPLAATWETALADDERLLRAVEPAGGQYGAPCFFTVRCHVLSCRDVATGRACWTHSLSEIPTWLGLDADLVLVAGPQRVQALRLTDGRSLWVFRPAQWAAAARLATFAAQPRLSDFRLSGDRVCCLVANRELCAIAATTGRLLWSVPAAGASVRPAFPGGRFGAYYHAGKGCVVLQPSGRKAIILESATGQRLHELAASADFWATAPQATTDGGVALVPDSQHVVQLDTVTGKRTWSAEFGFPTVTAQSPVVVTNQRTLLAIIDGSELARLDVGTGTVLWSILAGTGSLSADQVTVDRDAVYVVQDRRLLAASLVDGHQLWELALPEAAAGWRVLQSHGSLLVFPRRARQEMGQPWLTSAYVAVFPLELAWRDVPLVLCHAGLNPGGLRLQIPARGPDVSVQPVVGGVVVGTVGHVRAFQRVRALGQVRPSSSR